VTDGHETVLAGPTPGTYDPSLVQIPFGICPNEIGGPTPLGRSVARFTFRFEGGLPVYKGDAGDRILIRDRYAFDYFTNPSIPDTDPPDPREEEIHRMTCGPEGITTNDDGSLVFVANYHTGSVSIIETDDDANDARKFDGVQLNTDRASGTGRTA